MEPGNPNPIPIPLVVAGEEVFDNREVREFFDPSQINEKTKAKVLVATSVMGSEKDVEKAVTTTRDDPDGWQGKSQEERHRILSRVAMEIRRARGDLIGAASACTGKVFTEADPEVSEAIDFTEYYPYAVNTFTDLKNVICLGKGWVLLFHPGTSL